MHFKPYFLWLWLLCAVTLVAANRYTKKLYDKLLRKSGYNRLIRPVNNNSEQVRVIMGLKLLQLIDLDERNQIMTTNVWMNFEWHDQALTWRPEDFGNVTLIYVPIESIWNPDIVLYNNGNGEYELTLSTKAIIQWNGLIRWKPPASLKTACSIDVEFFPFDEQMCKIHFGSWTYNIDEVDISHMWAIDKTQLEHGIDLTKFYRSVEWDIMANPAKKKLVHVAGSKELFPEWTFSITMKRKFLFYTVNLIIPLIAHAFLTCLVFYLPSESREKVSLCITILLSVTVYFLMLTDIIPPSSVVVPLLGKYLLFCYGMVTFSIIITGISLNFHFRNAATHNMPDWIRKVFLYSLPKLLMMRRPKIENYQDLQLKYIKLNLCDCLSPGKPKQNMTSRAGNHVGARIADNGVYNKKNRTQVELAKLSHELSFEEESSEAYLRFSPETRRALSGAVFIANHMKQEDAVSRITEDWKYIALVLDRLFLYVYTVVCIGGTALIICRAPMLYDTRVPIVYPD